MKVLLINTNREIFPWPVVPLGLSYIAAALKQKGHAVRMLDLCFSRSPRRDIQRAVGAFGPEAVGITLRNIDNVEMLNPLFYLEAIRREIVEPLKSLCGAPLIIGGPAVGISPEGIMDYLHVDYALAGEGETGMAAWLAALESPAPDFSPIPGLHVRLSDGRIVAPHPPVLKAMDALPHPRPYTWMDYRPYARRGGTAGVQTKRGCVFKCIYCAYSLIEGCGHRLREPGDVVDEMEGWLTAARPRIFEFVDSVFNAPEDHAAGVCEAILRRGMKTRLTTMGFNPGPVSAGLISVMKAAGFRWLMCSPDSASPAMLDRLKKNFTIAQLASASDLLRRAGIKVFWFFTLGGPGETRETVQETLNFCRRYTAPEDLLLFSIGFRISPNTPLALEAREEGVIAKTDDLLLPAFYCSPHTSPLDIMTQIHQAALTHPNFITLHDFEIPSVIQGVLKFVVPFYKPRNDSFSIPSLNRGLNRLGILPRIHRRQQRRMARTL